MKPLTHPLVAERGVSRAKLVNDMRQAERDWQRHSSTDNWPGGNPWADMRDEAAARFVRLKAEVDAIPGRMRTTAAFMEARA